MKYLKLVGKKQTNKKNTENINTDIIMSVYESCQSMNLKSADQAIFQRFVISVHI